MTTRSTHAAGDLTDSLAGRWNGHHLVGASRRPAHDDRQTPLQIASAPDSLPVDCQTDYSNEAITDALPALPSLSSAHDSSHTPLPPRRDTSALARDVWASASASRGTLAERYRALRGLEDLHVGRFLDAATTYENGQRLSAPAFLLPYENATGITALLRIFLDPVSGDKTQLFRKTKRALGRPGDGAIRFGRIAGGVLNLTEDPEDAGSIMLWKHQPGCWASGGADRLSVIAIPDGIHTIRLWIKHGPVATRSLVRARPHLTDRNRKLIIETPPAGCDWNEAWLAARTGTPGTAR